MCRPGGGSGSESLRARIREREGKPEAVRGERDLLDRARQAVEGEVPVREALSAEDRKRLPQSPTICPYTPLYVT